MFRSPWRVMLNTSSTPTKTKFCSLWVCSYLSWLKLSTLSTSGYSRSTIWWRKAKAIQLSSGWRTFGWDLDFSSSPILCSHLWSFFCWTLLSWTRMNKFTTAWSTDFLGVLLPTSISLPLANSTTGFQMTLGFLIVIYFTFSLIVSKA